MLAFWSIITVATALAALVAARPTDSAARSSMDKTFELESWNQIVNVLSLYAYSVDSKNFDGLTDVFAPDGFAYFPPPYPVMNGSAEVIEVLESHTVGVTSQHLLGTFSIQVLDKSTATSHSYYSATFFNETPADDIYHHGQYYDTFRNIGEDGDMKWRIMNRTLLSWD